MLWGLAADVEGGAEGIGLEAQYVLAEHLMSFSHKHA